MLSADRALGALTVRGCTHDSRAVVAGDLYAALPGQHVHGADFAPQAVAAGAVAVLTDPAGRERVDHLGVPVLVAPSPRAVIGEVAAWVHGYPANDLMVLGVTGTNGKTTTAFMLEAGLRAAGHRTGLLGTVLTRIGSDVFPSTRTTPEATDLQALLALMRERAVTAVAMEISSHALALGRVDGVTCTVAGFTNLTQDHLDFHGDMASYFDAKASLFTPRRARCGVVSVDDPFGQRLAADAGVPVRTLSDGGAAYYQLADVESGPEGSSFTLTGGGLSLPCRTALSARFNAANAALAVAMLIEAGVPGPAAAAGVAGLAGVPGRLERVDVGQAFTALVDYAHTPEAVVTLLSSLRAVTAGRVLVVLGCGGDRDKAKRPLMGRAAVEGADVAVFTSDNPRGEDPLAILAEMAAEAPGAVIEPDRAVAIGMVVAQARAGDTVVIAGKGHETGQERDGVVTPFDDRDVLREALRSVTA